MHKLGYAIWPLEPRFSLCVVGVTIPALKDDYENELGEYLAEESVDGSAFPCSWELIHVVEFKESVGSSLRRGTSRGKEKPQ